jgi:hypothetical protein
VPTTNENIEPLLYWVHEREKIRLARLADAGAPWTDDPILTTYRFCNVHRRDDRVSAWLRKNVLTEKNIKADLSSFLLFAALCRWINWPPTIQAILDAKLYPSNRIDFAKTGRLLDKLSKTQKVWTGAYMIQAPKVKGAKKGKYIASTVVGKNLKANLPNLCSYFTEFRGAERSYKTVWDFLKAQDGYGSFMAGQIAGDLTYTSLLKSAGDLKTWAPIGPGSVRGFNRMLGVSGADRRALSRRPSEELWLEKLAEWRQAIIERMGADYEDLTALDVQNCLCEVDKYLRVKLEQGRPRARYSAHQY